MAVIPSVGNYPVGQQDTNLPWPPGFAGKLARAIEVGSYIPVKEVAITAALALLAAACGRGYRTHTGKDLALYIILIARSGIGKDGIHDGIPALLRLADIARAQELVRQEGFASGPALHKALLVEPGFLNLQGEFGRKLRGMANPNNAPMQDLRTVMTNAYAKQYLEGKTYSKAEDSLPGVDYPALSFLGETTPDTFLEALTTDMMEDGFLSRFLIVSYEGDRPSANPEREWFLDDEELLRLRDLLAIGTQYQGLYVPFSPRVVGFKNEDAEERLSRFDAECTDAINATTDEFDRQLWNRAHLKALKVAGLLAAADNPLKPEADLGHVVWAITLVRRDIETYQRRKLSGDIGSDDGSREQKIRKLIYEAIVNGVAPSHNVPPNMLAEGIVPRRYLQQRTSSSRPFKQHRNGHSAALDLTLRSLVDSGYVAEVPAKVVTETYQFRGKCYRIVVPLDQFVT